MKGSNKMATIFIMLVFRILVLGGGANPGGDGCDNSDEFSGSLAFTALILLPAAGGSFNFEHEMLPIAGRIRMWAINFHKSIVRATLHTISRLP